MTLRGSPLGNHKNGTRQEPFLCFVLGRHSEERVSGEKGIFRLLWCSDGVCVWRNCRLELYIYLRQSDSPFLSVISQTHVMTSPVPARIWIVDSGSSVASASRGVTALGVVWLCAVTTSERGYAG
ncbi:hypothetical protein MNBD_ACTINO02-1946 [hydrothermal vent metagenome]|uniref:Uncharacterized protein n=1 Tax=hydrothermal vent metagenome TaxID=652676 RepID=A0A3B0T039_9ZZZZ